MSSTSYIPLLLFKGAISVTCGFFFFNSLALHVLVGLVTAYRWGQMLLSCSTHEIQAYKDTTLHILHVWASRYK